MTVESFSDAVLGALKPAATTGSNETLNLMEGNKTLRALTNGVTRSTSPTFDSIKRLFSCLLGSRPQYAEVQVMSSQGSQVRRVYLDIRKFVKENEALCKAGIRGSALDHDGKLAIAQEFLAARDTLVNASLADANFDETSSAAYKMLEVVEKAQNAVRKPSQQSLDQAAKISAEQLAILQTQVALAAEGVTVKELPSAHTAADSENNASAGWLTDGYVAPAAPVIVSDSSSSSPAPVNNAPAEEQPRKASKQVSAPKHDRFKVSVQGQEEQPAKLFMVSASNHAGAPNPAHPVTEAMYHKTNGPENMKAFLAEQQAAAAAKALAKQKAVEELANKQAADELARKQAEAAATAAAQKAAEELAKQQAVAKLADPTQPLESTGLSARVIKDYVQAKDSLTVPENAKADIIVRQDTDRADRDLQAFKNMQLPKNVTVHKKLKTES